ncbi:hypothetical protein H6P81_009052 [Aristolochia fimbriata]|uniref:Uncharacterized protein n=1 Tax=Aristolochia fimbriata TaxID=158543 RepID=A0AAV7EMX8_ARIFI|nr:hypothetical protein H6P81_009052 [Aristolochia fimbriata]
MEEPSRSVKTNIYVQNRVIIAIISSCSVFSLLLPHSLADDSTLTRPSQGRGRLMHRWGPWPTGRWAVAPLFCGAPFVGPVCGHNGWWCSLPCEFAVPIKQWGVSHTWPPRVDEGRVAVAEGFLPFGFCVTQRAPSSFECLTLPRLFKGRRGCTGAAPE